MDSLSNVVLIFPRWGVILSRWGLYEHPRSHFILLKFISVKNPSNDSSNMTFFVRLEGISSLIYSKIPPPLVCKVMRKPLLKTESGKYHKNVKIIVKLMSGSNLFVIEFILI